jgi:uncharacterized membrane protein YphA (DoxX/SURF4 family)
MNTLNIFPDLLTFGLIAPLLLRVTVGLIFIYFGIVKLLKEKEFKISFFQKIGLGLKSAIFFFWLVAVIEIAGGILLIVGLYTQAVTLALLTVTAGAMYAKTRYPQSMSNSVEFFILLFIVLVSLLFLGAGFFAVDLPL